MGCELGRLSRYFSSWERFLLARNWALELGWFLFWRGRVGCCSALEVFKSLLELLAWGGC
jgi:hypothetical protein